MYPFISQVKESQSPGKPRATKFKITDAAETGSKWVSWKLFQSRKKVAPLGRHTCIVPFTKHMADKPNTTRSRLLACLTTLESHRWDLNAEQGSHLDDLFYVFYRPAVDMNKSLDKSEYSRVVAQPMDFATLRAQVKQGLFDENTDGFFSALERISANAELWQIHSHAL